MISRCFLIAVFAGVSLLAASQTARKTGSPATPKAADESQNYRNATFGFRYEIPYGWVDRTRDMREQQAESKGEAKTQGSATKNDVLLAVFERPPQAAGETVNSAVVIASEEAAAYPAIKHADDYLGPLTELAAAQGFRPEGEPSMVELDGRDLVRANFSKALREKITMRQTTLVLLAKGQLVSFTFIAGSEDEMDDLIDRLHFAVTKSGSR